MGITHENAKDRLIKHNISYYGTHFTSQVDDWKLKLEILCDTVSEARQLELYLKKMKSRKLIEKIIIQEESKKEFIQRALGTWLSR